MRVKTNNIHELVLSLVEEVRQMRIHNQTNEENVKIKLILPHSKEDTSAL